jgi:hypothetical protein
MDELSDRLEKAEVFIKFDLKNGFHLLCIHNGDECNTAFRSRYRLYKYMVMSFGLYNAPSTFQAMVNNQLHDLLNEGVIACIDDIFKYTEIEEEQVQLVKKVLERLTIAELCVSIKCLSAM